MSEKSQKTIQPLADYVLAAIDLAPTTTASGLYLPQDAAEKPKTATVKAVGPNVKELKAGDQIIYESYAGQDIKHGDVEYVLVKAEKVLALIK